MPDLTIKQIVIIAYASYLGHRMGILDCSTAEMKMSLDC